MAIGKESMERAARTAEKKTDSQKSTQVKAAQAEKKDVVVCQPDTEALDKVTHSNEIFGIGDVMPIYYL